MTFRDKSKILSYLYLIFYIIVRIIFYSNKLDINADFLWFIYIQICNTLNIPVTYYFLL